MKNSFILFCLILGISPIVEAQNFTDFIDYLNALPSAERQAKVDSFMIALDQTPVVETDYVSFVFQSTGSNIAVPGDFNGWNPNAAPLSKVSGTNLWYRTYAFDNAARLEYKIFEDGNWYLDMDNPYYAFGGFGANSELRMPDYIPPSEVITDFSVPSGTLLDTTFYSSNLSNNRQIKVYTPPGYESSSASYPTVLVHDGLEYVDIAEMPTVLDNLISAGLIEPVIALFVPPVNRTPEYANEDQADFTDFIIEEIYPWLDQRFRTKTSASDRAVIGSSLGGNISLWLGLTEPETFGNIGAFSPYIEEDIRQLMNTGAIYAGKVYMNHGTYDHLNLIHESVDFAVPVMENKGYDHIYAEYPEGHSYYFWRAYLDDALIYFFPGPVSSVADAKTSDLQFNLEVYPNPLSDSAWVEYSLSKQVESQLILFKSDGHLHKVLDYGNYAQGMYKKVITKSESDSVGTYVVVLFVNGVSAASRKVVFE
jgi:enterochelin esterase-like enzyme